MASVKVRSANGFDYKKGGNGRVSISENDLIISTAQPKSTLAQVLFEPEPYLSDSLTYDITAWSLPIAFGLEAYATTQTIKSGNNFQLEKYNSKPAPDAIPYALLAKWQSVGDGAFLSDLLKNGLKVRSASKAFSMESQSFGAGTLVLTRADNFHDKEWAKLAQKIAAKHEQTFSSVKSGFSTNGMDLGSDGMRLISAPDIVVLYGKGVNVNSYGYIWHYLEQEVNQGFTALDLSQLESGKFMKHNTLILPEGGYRLSEDLLKKINTWVSGGGKLIALGSANSKLADQDGYSLKNPESSHSTVKQTPYARSERSHISKGTPGAIVKLKMDATHPLSFGLTDTYYSLKTNNFKYPKLEKGWNVGTVDNQVTHLGFIGHELLSELPNTMTFGIQEKGGGKIIYLVDDPLFRGFWYNGKLLFSNALFL